MRDNNDTIFLFEEELGMDPRSDKSEHVLRGDDNKEILRCAPNDKVRNCKGMNPFKLQFIFIFNGPRHECLG
jgi:hypothetical protein